MSIYASWLSIDDDEHDETCGRWVQVEKGDPTARMFMWDGREFAENREATCTCENKAPLIYQGSHVNPDDSDPRGGYLLACAIPNHCHPSVRGSLTDDGPPVNFLRLSMGEHADTYHGMEKGHATLVLDLPQVQRLRDTLTQWLEAEERM